MVLVKVISLLCAHKEHLKSHLKWMYGDQPYKMVLIIITKRINSRLFLNGGNQPPGTVADDYVTMPERYDFYLVSRSIHHSAVTPTA
jgi:aubergine-like protein